MNPNDAAWHLLQFEIHHTDPAVEQLPVHLPFENNICYTQEDNLEEVLADPTKRITKLTAWFQANKENSEAAQYTYAEFPEHYAWHADVKKWGFTSTAW